uniref:Glutathione S-transferase omega n=1 Tax=Crassostrea ariakensis TaxID=3244846 RepID=E1U2Z1_CRAAR|nr:glutathione S-transferase omega class protein [Crassostrea ariakensis]
MPTQKSFATGSACPDLEAGKLRVYSMRFCPYAQRTLLVLAQKNIPHEVVNINLKNKPEWFLQKNPLGRVPTLEKDDKIVYESAICCDYLDQVYPDNKLTPDDPYCQARDKMTVEVFSQFVSDLHKVMNSTPQENPESLQKVKNHLSQLESVITARQGGYFGGNAVQMLDLMLWPWYEYLIFAKVVPLERLSGVYPALCVWTEKMPEWPSVQKCRLDSRQFLELVNSIKSSITDYDVGLDQDS